MTTFECLALAVMNNQAAAQWATAMATMRTRDGLRQDPLYDLAETCMNDSLEASRELAQEARMG